MPKRRGPEYKHGELMQEKFLQAVALHRENNPFVLDARGVEAIARKLGMTQHKRVLCDYLRDKGWRWTTERGYERKY